MEKTAHEIASTKLGPSKREIEPCNFPEGTFDNPRKVKDAMDIAKEGDKFGPPVDNTGGPGYVGPVGAPPLTWMPDVVNGKPVQADPSDILSLIASRDGANFKAVMDRLDSICDQISQLGDIMSGIERRVELHMPSPADDLAGEYEAIRPEA